MNDTKNFTKIILAVIGLFFLVKLIPQLFFPIYFLFDSPSRQSFGVMLISMSLCGISILLIWYFFFHLRDRLAEKIVGTPTDYELSKQVPWFPLAMRLGCIFAGLYCLYNAMWKLIHIISLLRWYVERGSSFMTNQSVLAEIIRLLPFLAVGIYLVFGAPHFVRWQVKKTLEQCKKLENSESASGC